ncbi:MAG: hypothetical protein IPK82_19985 [Polyangiaceae bacterium]|nr:hypothetical protein [Polyangiaceae bacterium]
MVKVFASVAARSALVWKNKFGRIARRVRREKFQPLLRGKKSDSEERHVSNFSVLGCTTLGAEAHGDFGTVTIDANVAQFQVHHFAEAQTGSDGEQNHPPIGGRD